MKKMISVVLTAALLITIPGPQALQVMAGGVRINTEQGGFSPHVMAGLNALFFDGKQSNDALVGALELAPYQDFVQQLELQGRDPADYDVDTVETLSPEMKETYRQDFRKAAKGVMSSIDRNIVSKVGNTLEELEVRKYANVNASVLRKEMKLMRSAWALFGGHGARYAAGTISQARIKMRVLQPQMDVEGTRHRMKELARQLQRTIQTMPADLGTQKEGSVTNADVLKDPQKADDMPRLVAPNTDRGSRSVTVAEIVRSNNGAIGGEGSPAGDKAHAQWEAFSGTWRKEHKDGGQGPVMDYWVWRGNALVPGENPAAKATSAKRDHEKGELRGYLKAAVRRTAGGAALISPFVFLISQLSGSGQIGNEAGMIMMFGMIPGLNQLMRAVEDLDKYVKLKREIRSASAKTADGKAVSGISRIFNQNGWSLPSIAGAVLVAVMAGFLFTYPALLVVAAATIAVGLVVLALTGIIKPSGFMRTTRSQLATLPGVSEVYFLSKGPYGDMQYKRFEDVPWFNSIDGFVLKVDDRYRNQEQRLGDKIKDQFPQLGAALGPDYTIYVERPDGSSGKLNVGFGGD